MAHFLMRPGAEKGVWGKIPSAHKTLTIYVNKFV